MTHPVRSWPQFIDDARANPAAAAACAALIAQARTKAALPLLRRVYSLAQLGQQRTWLDNRALALEPDIRQTFALAMSDHNSCSVLAAELPLLAAAFRLSGDPALGQRVLAQLHECAAWSPLQRPGWTCYAGAHLPADGKDGSWLATGTGVRGLVTCLEIMPAGSVPAPLTAQLHTLLEAEITAVVDDWATARPWFVRWRNPFTNQWVLPNEGLVRACLALGRERRPQDYELGVANLLEAIDAHGPAGEFEEGLHYANFTVLAMWHTAYAMAVAGDRRALDKPFLQRFPLWAVHHLMPARLGINAFDAFAAGVIQPDQPMMRQLLGAAAAFSGSPVARWALARQFNGPEPDPVGLAASSLPAADLPAPPLFAAYQRATRVNWRSSWDDDATGLWVRGGHATDQHDHHDRGHVSFILAGVPVLIETGTPAYHHPDLGRLFSTGPGHNVLQIGIAQASPDVGNVLRQQPLPGWQKPRTVAPIAVRRLDDAGGDVQVDISAGYDGLTHWKRDLIWSSDSLTVTDDVALPPGRHEILLFRWHLAAPLPVAIAGHDRQFTIDLPHATLTVTASAPLEITQEPRENHSLELRGWDSPLPYPLHTCLLVRTAEAVNGVVLTTNVTARKE